MGNNGLIDPRSCFSSACCFSGPVQCPATAPVAYKIKNYCSYSIYTKVQQDSLTAELPGQGGCRRLPVRARFRSPPAASAGASFEVSSPKFSQKSNRSPKCSLKTKSSLEARSANRPKRTSKGSSHRSRNLGFNATVECKCQEHNPISKELLRGSYHTKRIFEYIFE